VHSIVDEHMVAPETDSEEPQHLVLAGYQHEWPADFEVFVARELIERDGALMARLEELGDAPAFLSGSEVTALIVNANRLGLKGKVALRECRRISPSTAVVVVATTAAHGLKDALEGGATAFVSWPAAPEVLRRALRVDRGGAALSPRLSGVVRGGVDGPR
jgi:DNA-binding NarL/FixJ family response regulator